MSKNSTTPTTSLRDSIKPADGDTGPKHKERLDEKARENKYVNEGKEPSLVEKVAANILGVSALLGSDTKTEKKMDNKAEELSGPPERPHHDKQIEEFVRDQHRSKNKGGVLE